MTANTEQKEKLLDDIEEVSQGRDSLVQLGMLSAPKPDEFAGKEITDEFIRDEVLKILSLILTVPIDDITPTSDIVDDLGGDSLDVQEIVLTLEDYFGVNIPEGQVEVMTTPQVIIGYLVKRKNRIRPNFAN